MRRKGIEWMRWGWILAGWRVVMGVQVRAGWWLQNASLCIPNEGCRWGALNPLCL